MGPLAIASALQSDCGRSRAKNDLPLTPVRSEMIRASKNFARKRSREPARFRSTVDSNGRTIWIADAHGYGKRFIVRADEKLTAFVELQRAFYTKSWR